MYCDIKPSNTLLDENGRLKLGGFGLSRRLSDINKTPYQALPQVADVQMLSVCVCLPKRCGHPTCIVLIEILVRCVYLCVLNPGSVCM